jgi:hypothetical protein
MAMDEPNLRDVGQRIVLLITRQGKKFRKSWSYESEEDRRETITWATRVRDRFKQMVPAASGGRPRQIDGGRYGVVGVTLVGRDNYPPYVRCRIEGKSTSFGVRSSTPAEIAEKCAEYLSENSDHPSHNRPVGEMKRLIEQGLREDLRQQNIEHDFVQVQRHVYRRLYRMSGAPDFAPEPGDL